MGRRKLIHKRAQAWGLDVIVASTIFLVGVVVLYFYAINYAANSQEGLEELFYEGQLASELILSDEDFGLLEDGKINQTKLDNFNSSYSSRKNSLGVTNDFYFYLEGLEISGPTGGTHVVSYVGKINTTPIEDLVKITRVTIYRNQPVKFELFIYR